MGLSSIAAVCAVSAQRLIAFVRDAFQLNGPSVRRYQYGDAVESGICLSDKQLNCLGISEGFR
jgi:hypothetical protein